MDIEKIGDHSYLDMVSSIPYEKRILEEERKEKIFNALKKLFEDNYNCSKKLATVKARDVIEGTNEASSHKPEINNSSKRREYIDKAVSRGYIENFKLKDPWHPEICVNPQKITSYPYQHTTAILYTGQEKHLFFSKTGKRDILERENFSNFYNPESILNQGYIKPGNKGKDVNQGVLKEGTYFATLSHAKGYSASSVVRDLNLYQKRVILEIQIPTRWLIIDDIANRFTDISTIEELKENFKSPENFREYLKESKDRHTEFKTSIRPGIPLKYVRGVWDREKFSEPKFMTLKEYYRHIHSDFPDRVPDNPEKLDIQISKKKREFTYFEEHWSRIRKFMQFFIGSSSRTDRWGIIDSLERIDSGYFDFVASYNYNLKKAKKYLSQEIGIENTFSHGEVLDPINSKEELKEKLPVLEKKVKKIYRKMQRFNQEYVEELRETDPNQEEIEKVIEKQRELENDLAKLYLLPSIRIQ